MSSEEPAKPVMYKIHSMVRSVHTRTQRTKSPKRHRFVQRLGGGAITVRRTRPATITKELLERYLEEIKQGVEEGRLVVKTPTGEVVDLTTMTATPKPVADSPRPEVQPDSAANDKTYDGGVGQHMPIFPDGGGQMQAPPDLSTTTSLTGEDEAPIQGGGDPVKAREAAQAAQAAPAEPVVQPEGQPEASAEPVQEPPAPEAPVADEPTEKAGKKSGGKSSKKGK